MAQQLNSQGQPVDQYGNPITAQNPGGGFTGIQGQAVGGAAGPGFAPTWGNAAPIAAPTTPTAPAAAPGTGTISQLIAGGGTGASGTGTSAPVANPFAGAVNNYTNSAPPTASTATMAPNQYAGDLSASEQRLQDLINNPSSLQDSASYKFRVDQGQQALERSLGAKGMLQSGNRLQALTDYGQASGSQEYEAENARRLAAYTSASGNYNANQTANVNQLSVQQGSLDKNYATAGSIYGQQGQTIAGLYDASNTAANTRYATDTTAATARGNTLADLYRTDTYAQTAKLPYQQQQLAPKPWWQTSTAKA